MAHLPGLPFTKSIRVATPYASVDELVAAFWRYCEPDACFVPSQQLRPVGLHAAFAILLRDGRPALRGRCVVDAAYAADAASASPHQRAGLRLRIRTLSSDSSPLYAQLLARRDAAIPEAVPDDATVPNPFEPSYSATPTVAVDALPHGAAPPSRPRAAFPALSRPTVRGVPPMRAPGAPAQRLWIGSSPTAAPRPPLLRRILRALLSPWRAWLGRSRPRPSARGRASAVARSRSRPA